GSAGGGPLFLGREALEEVDDLLVGDLLVGGVLELRLEEDAPTRFAGVVVQRVLPVSAVDADQVDLALRALPGERLGVDPPAQALQPWQVVMQQQPVQIRDVYPQSAALPTSSQRRLFPLHLGHLDVAARAIHEGASSPAGGAMLRCGAKPSLGGGKFALQPRGVTGAHLDSAVTSPGPRVRPGPGALAPTPRNPGRGDRRGPPGSPRSPGARRGSATPTL